MDFPRTLDSEVFSLRILSLHVDRMQLRTLQGDYVVPRSAARVVVQL